MKKIATLVAATVFAASASAAEIGVTVASRHFDDNDYRERNPGLYVIGESFAAGTFVNSYDERATFVATSIGEGRLKLHLGGITGYRELTGMSVSPFAAASYKIGPVRVLYSPMFVGVGVELSF